MLFPLYPIIFQDIRGLNEGVGDLPFLATLGGVVAAIGIQFLYQIKYRRDLAANNGKHTPELRLAPTYLGGPVMVVALVSEIYYVNTSSKFPADLSLVTRRAATALARMDRLQIKHFRRCTCSIRSLNRNSKRARL